MFVCSVSSRRHLIRVFEVGLLTCNFSSTIKRTYIWQKNDLFCSACWFYSVSCQGVTSCSTVSACLSEIARSFTENLHQFYFLFSTKENHLNMALFHSNLNWRGKMFMSTWIGCVNERIEWYCNSPKMFTCFYTEIYG